MKWNKKQAGLIAGVVCVILLIILLLTMCKDSGDKMEPAPSSEATTTIAQTQPEAETTEAETTEATEETTEAPEETTEATEETTKPTTGGNTRPGGTGGPSVGGGGNDSNQNNQGAVTETIPAAGSEGSPYYELVTTLPDAFKTVAIPVDSTVYHNLDIVGASILTIEDADAYVIYNEKKYEADENGVVTLALAAAEEDVPVSVQIGNKNAAEKAFSLQFGPPVGDSRNPDVLTGEDTVDNGKWSKELSVVLPAGNKDGYNYLYTAAEAGNLAFSLRSVTEGAACDILITVGDKTVKLSESTTGAVAVDLAKDDVAAIQIVALPAADGTYPAVDASASCVFTYPAGTIKNPIPVDELTTVTAKDLAPGDMVYYCAENLKGSELLIENNNAYIQIADVKYPAESGRVKVTVSEEGPIVFGVGNDGTAARSFVLNVKHAIGSKVNPKILTAHPSRKNKVTTLFDYYYTHTAKAGTGTITMEIVPEESSNWTYMVKNLTTGECSEMYSSTDETIVSSYMLGTNEADVIQVVIGTSGDQEASVAFRFKAGDKEASAVSDVALKAGENVLKNISTATTTVYRFVPEAVGTYVFETDAGTLSYWGSAVEGMANATATESAQLTQTTTVEGETILVGITGSLNCTLTVTKTESYTGEEPGAYTVNLGENQQVVAMDLTRKYALSPDENGFYHAEQDGPIVFVDFTSDAYVNLVKLMETKELYQEVTAEDGTVTRVTYNALLQKYIAAATVIQVSETESRTLYPLTKDLMDILQNAGAQLGWYDSTSAGYLFGALSGTEPDSLWMFTCCTVQTEVNTANEETEPADPETT